MALLPLLQNAPPPTSAPSAPPVSPKPASPPQDAGPLDPPATTEWHQEPVLEKTIGKNVVLYNHADATLESKTIVGLLQQQYDFLKEYVGVAPRWVLVHVGNRYPLGFMIRNGPDPEMFLQAGGIFDTSANYAHEMMHCFMSEFGGAIPHWFNESMSDMAYFDSEFELWKRRREPWLDQFDRVDYRSYELLQLRRSYGRAYFRKVCAGLVKRTEECRKTFANDVKIDAKNELLLAVLSEAAGEDVMPRMKEMGFNPRTRERQRGY